MSQRTTTRVQVTVEVIDQQPWAADCTAGTIYLRAKEHALLQVQSALQRAEIVHRIRIIGEPYISLVMTEDKP